MEATKLEPTYQASIYNEAQHYPILKSWWEKHRGWEPIPTSWLPKTGIIVEYDGKPVAAGFMYYTNSIIAWIEWVVADPEAEKEIRSTAVDLLIQAISTHLYNKGFKVQFTTVKDGPFKKRLTDKHEFETADSGMNTLWRRFK